MEVTGRGGGTRKGLKKDVGQERRNSLSPGTTKNPDVSTEPVSGPLARPFVRSLATLTHSLATHCSLRSTALIRSLAHSLTPELLG